MSNYNAVYTTRAPQTWGAVLLLGVMSEGTVFSDLPRHTHGQKPESSYVRLSVESSTYDTFRVESSVLPWVDVDQEFLEASQRFVDGLSVAQEQLGYDFSKVIDDNFLDLLA